MAELKDVVEAILLDLIEARYKADQYSSALSAEYFEQSDLINFSPPSVDIGNVKVEIKFALADGVEGDNSSEVATPKLDSAKKLKVISTAIHKALNNNSLILKESSDPTANKASLSRKMAKAIIEYTDPNTLKIDQDQALAIMSDLVTPHLGKTANGRPVSAQIINPILKSAISDAEKRMSDALDTLKQEQLKRPQIIVDINKLKEIEPRLISNLSLDLDLMSIDQYELDG